MPNKENQIDFESCLEEIHNKLYKKETGPGKACSTRAWILYYYLKNHNLEAEIVRYKRKDAKNIVLFSKDAEKARHHTYECPFPSHVFVTLNNLVLDSNFKKSGDKKQYMNILNEINDNQIYCCKPVNQRFEHFIDIVRKSNLSERFKKVFK